MTTTEPKIKSVAPWAGNKRRLAPRIIGLLGEHTAYIEPFCGGCAILPQKPRTKTDWVNDMNPGLVNVLRCLQDHGEKICSDLELIPFDRVCFERSREVLADNNPDPNAPDPYLAARQLVVWWMGPSGMAGTDRKPWFAQRHTKTGGDPAVRWNSFRASLPLLCERLRGVTVTRHDGFNILRHVADCAGTAFYCDPPYFSKSFRYAVDFSDADHERLAVALNRFRRARVVVSYYGSPTDGRSRLDALYPPDRWERHEVAVSKASANAVRTGTTRTAATEVLLVNRV